MKSPRLLMPVYLMPAAWLAGPALQWLSALLTAALLGVFFHVRWDGMALWMPDGIDAAREMAVLPETPHAAALVLWLALTAWSAWCFSRRPQPSQALMSLVLAGALACLANTFRTTLVAVGLAFPNMVAGLPVMAPPWHELIGLGGVLACGLPFILQWGRGRHAAPFFLSFQLPHRVRVVGACAVVATILLLFTHHP